MLGKTLKRGLRLGCVKGTGRSVCQVPWGWHDVLAGRWVELQRPHLVWRLCRRLLCSWCATAQACSVGSPSAVPASGQSSHGVRSMQRRVVLFLHGRRGSERGVDQCYKTLVPSVFAGKRFDDRGVSRIETVQNRSNSTHPSRPRRSRAPKPCKIVTLQRNDHVGATKKAPRRALDRAGAVLLKEGRYERWTFMALRQLVQTFILRRLPFLSTT